jgi:hypothetical protein
MPTDVDAFTDPQIDVVARLLYESLRARYGEAILAQVTKRPITTYADLASNQFPLLVVSRLTERTDPDDDVSDNEIVTLAVEFYTDLTPLDTVSVRWPALRAIWRHCLTRLHAGFDPLVTDHHVNVAASGEPERLVPMMAAQGWAVPARPVSNVKYLLMETEADPRPCFQAQVTMRITDAFDWTFSDTFVHPTIEGVDSDVNVADPEDDDADHTEDGFTSSITFA